MKYLPWYGAFVFGGSHETPNPGSDKVTTVLKDETFRVISLRGSSKHFKKEG